MIFDVIIREKTTGNTISLKNVSREYLTETFQDRIKQLWLNEKVATTSKVRRKVSKQPKTDKTPKI